MGKIISCNNRKGGSGKTTTSINLAKGLADEGLKVLLVDLDLQGNTSSKFLEDYEEINGIVEVINGEISIEEAIYKTDVDNLYIVPTKLEWMDCIEQMTKDYYLLEDSGKTDEIIKMIKRVLEPVKEKYDVIILDNNPSYKVVLKNCVYAADLIIVPVNIDRNAIKGVDYTIRNIVSVINDSDEDIHPRFMVLVTKRTRTRVSRECVEQIRKTFNDAVFESTIANQIAPAEKQTFFDDYFMIDDLKNSVGKDYRHFVSEIRKEMNI